MESPDQEELMKVAAIVLGAGTSGAVSGVVKGVVPQLGADVAGAAAGALLYYFGDRIHPLVKMYGIGVLAGSLKGMVEKATRQVTGAGAAPSDTGGSGGSDALAAAKANYGWT